MDEPDFDLSAIEHLDAPTAFDLLGLPDEEPPLPEAQQIALRVTMAIEGYQGDPQVEPLGIPLSDIKTVLEQHAGLVRTIQTLHQGLGGNIVEIIATEFGVADLVEI